MAQVPEVAPAAVVRPQGAILAASVAAGAAGLAAADEDGLRGAATLDGRQVAVDELAVRDDAHAGIVGERRDSYRSRSSGDAATGVMC